MPNPYPANFTQLLDALPPGSIVLDLGGGGRSRIGVMSMDLIGGDLIGDCLALPLRDNCVDLVLSQAVLEHVREPQRAIDEVLRILKPGAALYVEAAFMQPIHMAPDHYFNITPYGLKYLLRDWDVEWTSATGTPREVLAWVSRTYGMPRCRPSSRRVEPEKYTQASCGVSALARKPV